MRTLRLHGLGDIRLHEDEPEPTPGPGEALVQVLTVGLCGSDLHWFSEAGIGSDRLERPLVLGHEFAGRVLSGPLSGQLVAVDPCIPCGRCRDCQEGNPNLCPYQRFAGHSRQDGGLRERLVWPERLLYPLPDPLTPEDGAMLEPLGIAVHSLGLSHLKIGMRVGVFGCGPIGLLLVQLARRMGAAQVIATDRLPHRVEAALSCGADRAFRVEGNERDAEILAEAGGDGVDVAFEVAGEDASVETSVNVARNGAKVILVGIPSSDHTTFTASTARRKGLTFKICRRMKHTFPRAIELVRSGQADVRSLVTHVFALEEFSQAFETAVQRQGLKVIVRPTAEQG